MSARIRPARTTTPTGQGNNPSDRKLRVDCYTLHACKEARRDELDSHARGLRSWCNVGSYSVHGSTLASTSFPPPPLRHRLGFVAAKQYLARPTAHADTLFSEVWRSSLVARRKSLARNHVLD